MRNGGPKQAAVKLVFLVPTNVLCQTSAEALFSFLSLENEWDNSASANKCNLVYL